MIGTFYHSIDAKGRLFIPARLREDLGEVFFVTLSLENCLTAYSNERWENALDKLRAMPQAAQIELRPIFSKAVKCELDGQGRILLPQTLRDVAALDKSVTIVGTGLYVQFWDTETYKEIEARETKPENIAKVIREYGF